MKYLNRFPAVRGSVWRAATNPADAALGVEHQEFSPGVRRMTAVAGSDSNFDLAREQIELLAGKLIPNHEARQKRWMMILQHWLDHGKIKKLVTSLQATQTPSTELSETTLRTEAEYFRSNARRMRYPKSRRLHLFVGTGVMEAG